MDTCTNYVLMPYISGKIIGFATNLNIGTRIAYILYQYYYHRQNHKIRMIKNVLQTSAQPLVDIAILGTVEACANTCKTCAGSRSPPHAFVALPTT